MVKLGAHRAPSLTELVITPPMRCLIMREGVHKCRLSVPLEVWELEVQSHYRFEHYRFGLVRNSGLIGSVPL